MQKIRKILQAISEKTALQTIQPINYYQQHQFCRTTADGTKRGIKKYTFNILPVALKITGLK